jgi:hypothetical protein
MRHEDEPFLQFLQFIRHSVPTQEQIDDCLGKCYVSEAWLQSNADESWTILCSHRAQVTHWNNFMMQKLFKDSSTLRQTTVLTSAIGILELEEWCKDAKFHQLDFVAEGAKVVITQNMDLTVGAANGAT